MGGKKSKSYPPKKCVVCGNTDGVSNTPGFKDMCQSCVRNKLKKDEDELNNKRQISELEREKIREEINRKRREAELELKERELRIERERVEQEIETKRSSDLAKLQVQMETIKTKFEKAKHEDAEKNLEIEREHTKAMKDLKVEEERLRLEAEAKLKEAELDEIERLSKVKEEYERKEKEQALLHAKEMHDLKLEIERDQHEHNKKLAIQRAEIEGEFMKNAAANLMLTQPSGAAATLSLSNNANPALAEMLMRTLMTDKPGEKREAIKDKAENICSDGPGGQSEEPATGQ